MASGKIWDKMCAALLDLKWGTPFLFDEHDNIQGRDAEVEPVFDDDISLSDGLRDFHFYVGQVMGKMRCGEQKISHMGSKDWEMRTNETYETTSEETSKLDGMQGLFLIPLKC